MNDETGVSHELIKRDWCELAVDANRLIDDYHEERLFDLTMGHGFSSGNKPSSNIQMSNLTLDDLEAIYNNLGEVIQHYKDESFPSTDELGTKFWKNGSGQLHRLDGPAVEYKDGSKYWFKNGEIHREDGPAVENVSGQHWYLNDKKVTKEEVMGNK